MITRNEVLEYIEDTYDVFPEYIFKKFPSYCVFKHKRGKKWFGLLMTINKSKLDAHSDKEIDVIDVKIEPELGDILKNSPAIYPAYHMNKEHWVTVDL
ncbi:MAG: MmcQ/YjbR family DNA-binding protein [Enterococcus sp.]